MNRIAATLAVLLLPTLCAGDCREAVLAHQPRVVQRVVVDHGHAYAHHARVERVLAVQAYPVYQVGYELRQEAVIEKALERLVEKLEAREAQRAAHVPCHDCGNPHAPAPRPEPRHATPSDGIPEALATIFQQKCVRCHAGASAAAGLDLTDVAVVVERHCDIFKAVYSGSMPKGGEPLSDAEVEVVLDWFLAQ